MRYYLMLSCDLCDADVYLGPSLTTLEYRGAPVISAFDAEQQTFVCEECETRHHTGELDMFVEENNRDA